VTAAETAPDADEVTSLQDEVTSLQDEVDELHAILSRQRAILTGVANALRGDPGPLASHSHHDLAERAAAVVAEIATLRAVRLEPMTPTALDAAVAAEDRATADEPLLDGTDGAHPAWWRGHDRAAEMLTAQRDAAVADAARVRAAYASDLAGLRAEVRRADDERDVRRAEAARLQRERDAALAACGEQSAEDGATIQRFGAALNAEIARAETAERERDAALADAARLRAAAREMLAALEAPAPVWDADESEHDAHAARLTVALDAVRALVAP